MFSDISKHYFKKDNKESVKSTNVMSDNYTVSNKFQSTIY